MTRDELAKANAPTVPPETCPIVDRLSARLDAVAADLDRFREEVDGSSRKTVPRYEVLDVLLEARRVLASSRLIAEELRNANDQLRASGRYWRGVAKGANEQLEGLLDALEPYGNRLPTPIVALLEVAREAA